MEHEAIANIAQQYRDEGFDVVEQPRGEHIPPPFAGFEPDLIATRGNEGVVVEIKSTRIDLSNDDRLLRLSEIVDTLPAWRLDVVILERETAVEKAAQTAGEPSDEQLEQILEAAEAMADQGFVSYACVVAWGGLEAAMRRLRDDAELYGQTTPTELMSALYSNGFLSREQFDRLRESYKIRSQVVHGLVPTTVQPELVRYVTATARSLVSGQAAAVST